MSYLRQNSNPEDRRKRDLAAIHAGANQLGMEDDARRDLIERISTDLRGAGHGVRSAGDLNIRERAAVLDELRRLGAGNSPRTKGKPHNFPQLDAEITKIEAQLADMQLPWSYADAIAKRMFGIQRCAWLRQQKQLVAVLSALHNEQRKRDLGAAINRMQAALGITDDAIRAPKNWRRSIPALVAVHKTLDALLQARRGETP